MPSDVDLRRISRVDARNSHTDREQLSNVLRSRFPRLLFSWRSLWRLVVTWWCAWHCHLWFSPSLKHPQALSFTGHERRLWSNSFVRSKEFLSNACPSERMAYVA